MTNSRQRRNLQEKLNIKTSKRKQEREWEKERSEQWKRKRTRKTERRPETENYEFARVENSRENLNNITSRTKWPKGKHERQWGKNKRQGRGLERQKEDRKLK